MLNKNRYSVLKVGIISAFMMLIIMLPSMIQNHGIFIIRGDYVDQYIPRLIKAKEIITSGGGSWDWFNFLGAPYNKIDVLFNLNSVCLLFPAKIIPYALTYMHMIRIAIIAMAAYCYLKYMVKEQKIAFLGAILYTFSSYTFVNMEFMQFLDAQWPFPLLLLSAEKMFRDENYKHQLILAVFLSCATSFYIFVFSTLSFGIYFLCRFFLSEEWKPKRKAKYFLLAVFEYFIGTLCAGVIFAPFIYKLFNSAGSSSLIGKEGTRKLFYDIDFVSRFFSFFVPAASNRFSTFGRSAWSSRVSYIPIFGMSFVVAYALRRDSKKWLVILSIISVFCIAVSGISLVFNMFSSTYTRYAYSMILFFVLATVMFLKNYNAKDAKKGVYLTLAALILLFAVYYISSAVFTDSTSGIYYILHGKPEEQGTAEMFRIYLIIVTALMYICLLGYVHSEKIRKAIIPIVILMITIYGCSYTLMNLNSNHLLDYFPESTIDLKTQVEKYFIDKPEMDEGKDYRIDFTKQLRNYAYATTKPSISVFESVRNSHTQEMSKFFNMNRIGAVSVFPLGTENELRTLFGVKYYYDLYPEDKLEIPNGFTHLKTENGIEIYQNDNYIGMGFSYDSYITRSEFEKITEGRDCAPAIMLNTLVVEDEDVHFVADILMPFEEGRKIKERKSLENFKTNSSGFTATFNSAKPEIVYVSLPFESSGWFAEINGKSTKFIKANVGCVAFKTEPGLNKITFKYVSPVRNIGFCVTGFGLLLLVLYVVIYRKNKRRI